MTKRDQCKLVASFAYIKCTWSSEYKEFRVTLDGMSKEKEESVAYYTNDFQDAYDTAENMSRRRQLQIAHAHTFEGSELA